LLLKPLASPFVRLLFQCKYSGESAEALIFEVNPVPPPQSVAALGQLRVELRLANGHCFHKGCVEGKLRDSFLLVKS